MSRLAKKPIVIPQGVNVEIAGNRITIKGSKGTLDFTYHNEVKVNVTPDGIVVLKKGNSKKAPAIWGTTARIIENMIKGVSEGFKKQLELNGVGFRMAVQGKKINLALGFSHPVEIQIPEGIEASTEGNILNILGIDKQKVGQFAADIRALKPAEPYKGKGFRYVGEVVRRKESKKAVSTPTSA